jgi:hypothetical protein
VSWSRGPCSPQPIADSSDAARRHGHGEPGVDRQSAAARGPSAARERYDECCRKISGANRAEDGAVALGGTSPRPEAGRCRQPAAAERRRLD